MTHDDPRMGDLSELVERLRMGVAVERSLTGNGWHISVKATEELLAQSAAALTSLIAERDGAIAKWERADGMDGAVVHAIRELLNAHNVPLSAFIDDHVANAIRQRNAAEAQLKAAREALNNIRELNMSGVDDAGHRWANSDLIEQEIVTALSLDTNKGDGV